MELPACINWPIDKCAVIDYRFFSTLDPSSSAVYCAVYAEVAGALHSSHANNASFAARGA